MAIGKRFKKKMQNPRAGNSYWRIWGWPLKTYNVSGMKESYKDNPCYAFYEDTVGAVVIYTEQITVRGNRYLNGQTQDVPLVRTKPQAVRFVNQIKQGLYPRAIAGIREFHEMMDDLEECLFDDGYIDESYLDFMDRVEPVETPVQQLTPRVVSKTLHQHFVGQLQENGMFEKQAEEVMQLYWKSPYAASADLADKSTDGYDEMLFGLLWMGIRAVALEYINANCPKAWFKAVFDDSDPIHQKLADINKHS